MYLKIIINIILIIILGIFQIAFISGLPFWLGKVNLLLIILILLLGFNGSKIAYWWAFGFGFLLDSYMFVPFGTNIISLLATIIFSNFLLTNFLTNRSLYSFLFLTGFAIVCDKILLFLILNSYNYILSHSLLFMPDGKAIVYDIYSLCADLLLMSIALYGLNHFGVNFKPVFLRKRKIV